MQVLLCISEKKSVGGSQDAFGIFGKISKGF